MDLIKSIPIPLENVAPMPENFLHPSSIHGQEHVSRVMIHAFLLLQLTQQQHLSSQLWASVYLHDLARTHDGLCYRHGADAARRFPEFQPLFQTAGLREEEGVCVRTAVAWHAVPREMHRRHRYAPLVHLLKDADGLDRVRLGDLNPRYLRYSESHALINFAQALFDHTHRKAKPGPEYFTWLWTHAQTLCEHMVQKAN
jgi:hypothetical protein